MLEQQQTISFSDYSSLYDLIIPKDNLLRQITDLVDFSFVYQELQDKYCHDNGRTAESPIRMFKYLLLKVIYDISDVDVVERTRYDMSFKYFLGLTPEETNLINPSSLTKFRRLRLKDMDLLDLLIKKTVSIAIEAGVLKSKIVIVDATHSLSRSNPISAAKSLEYNCKTVIKVVNSVDDSMVLPELPEEKKYSSIMKAAKAIVATVEADAATANMPAGQTYISASLLYSKLSVFWRFPFSTKEFNGAASFISLDFESSMFDLLEYAVSATIASISIPADSVFSMSAGNCCPSLFSPEVTVAAVIILSSLIAICVLYPKNEEFAVLCPMRASSSLDVMLRISASSMVSLSILRRSLTAGILAVRKSREFRPNDKAHKNDRFRYFFDIDKCKVCPLRNGCYRPGAKSKCFNVTIKTEAQKELLEYQKTPEFAQLQRKRYKIEAKNAELKNVLGYGRALSYGLSCMEMQGALTIFAANVKRILKLMHKA